MWTCGTALWEMKNCTLEMAYILMERGLPFLPRDCQGRLPVALVTSWAGGCCRKTLYLYKRIGDPRRYRGTHHNLELNACA